MIKDHPVKDGEKYRSSLDAHAALYKACCHMCVSKVLRNMAIQGYYITTDNEEDTTLEDWVYE